MIDDRLGEFSEPRGNSVHNCEQDINGDYYWICDNMYSIILCSDQKFTILEYTAHWISIIYIFLDRLYVSITERIVCNLCICVCTYRCVSFFYTPNCINAPQKSKKWILIKCIQLHFIFLAHTRMGSHRELL